MASISMWRMALHVISENGAGKSTLINVIAGTYLLTEGVTYDGQELRHLSPHQARLIGISPVFQEFSLVLISPWRRIFRGTRDRARDFCASPRCVSVPKPACRAWFDLDPRKPSAISRAPADGRDRQGASNVRLPSWTANRLSHRTRDAAAFYSSSSCVGRM
jgi:ABC-type dipeptide/oligopeptide/nickel transport system ATPase subunit